MPSAIRRINQFLLPLENHQLKKNPREGEKGKKILVPKISVESPLAGSCYILATLPYGGVLCAKHCEIAYPTCIFQSRDTVPLRIYKHIQEHRVSETRRGNVVFLLLSFYVETLVQTVGCIQSTVHALCHILIDPLSLTSTVGLLYNSAPILIILVTSFESIGIRIGLYVPLCSQELGMKTKGYSL